MLVRVAPQASLLDGEGQSDDRADDPARSKAEEVIGAVVGDREVGAFLVCRSCAQWEEHSPQKNLEHLTQTSTGSTRSRRR